MRTGHLSLCSPCPEWEAHRLVPCPHALRAVVTKRRTGRTVASSNMGAHLPLPSRKPIHSFKKFLILPQMGNSSYRIILTYEIHMFSVKSLHSFSHLKIISWAASMSFTAFISSPCCLPGSAPSLWGGRRTWLLEERPLETCV